MAIPASTAFANVTVQGWVKTSEAMHNADNQIWRTRFSHTAFLAYFTASTTTALPSTSSSLHTMHTSEYDYLFKLLLIGDSGVGKVCIPCRARGLHSILTRVPIMTVLSVAAFRRRHIHWELYQHYWCWLQDPDYWTRGQNGEVADCEWSIIYLLCLHQRGGRRFLRCIRNTSIEAFGLSLISAAAMQMERPRAFWPLGCYIVSLLRSQYQFYSPLFTLHILSESFRHLMLMILLYNMSSGTQQVHFVPHPL